MLTKLYGLQYIVCAFIYFFFSTIFRYGGLPWIILCFIIETGHGYCEIGFFSGKERMDTVNGWFYRETGYRYRGIGYYFLEKQEWILYMYDLIESRYGYNGIGFFLENPNWMV